MAAAWIRTCTAPSSTSSGASDANREGSEAMINQHMSLLAGALLLGSITAFATAFAAAEPINNRWVAAKGLVQAKTYTVTEAPTAPLELAKPKLPDLTGYTAEAVAKK